MKLESIKSILVLNSFKTLDKVETTEFKFVGMKSLETRFEELIILFLVPIYAFNSPYWEFNVEMMPSFVPILIKASSIFARSVIILSELIEIFDAFCEVVDVNDSKPLFKTPFEPLINIQIFEDSNLLQVVKLFCFRSSWVFT